MSKQSVHELAKLIAEEIDNREKRREKRGRDDDDEDGFVGRLLKRAFGARESPFGNTDNVITFPSEVGDMIVQKLKDVMKTDVFYEERTVLGDVYYDFTCYISYLFTIDNTMLRELLAIPRVAYVEQREAGEEEFALSFKIVPSMDILDRVKQHFLSQDVILRDQRAQKTGNITGSTSKRDVLFNLIRVAFPVGDITSSATGKKISDQQISLKLEVEKDKAISGIQLRNIVEEQPWIKKASMGVNKEGIRFLSFVIEKVQEDA